MKQLTFFIPKHLRIGTFSSQSRRDIALGIARHRSSISLANGKLPRAAGCWQARVRLATRAKATARRYEPWQSIAEICPACLPAGATTRLTFVRPALRPGPAGTNETPDLPTRGTARPVPFRTRERRVRFVSERSATG